MWLYFSCFFFFLTSTVKTRQSRRLQWYGDFGFRESNARCMDRDIELQIVTGDATRTCQSAVSIVQSIGFNCDSSLQELDGNVLRDYCCQACPTLQPSKAPTLFGTCSDNDDMLKWRMGYWFATCETEVERVTSMGSSCSEMQIWNGKLEDFCCASCSNNGVTCADDNSALDPYFGPGQMTCARLASVGLCLTTSAGGDAPLSTHCPVSCGLCEDIDLPEVSTTTTVTPTTCDRFNIASGEICSFIDFPETICRVLTNLHEFSRNCNEFCAAHGTNCVDAWKPLVEETCHGGSWIHQDCDFVSDGHICDCQDPAITLSPTTSHPSKDPTTSHPSAQPTSSPTSFPTSYPTTSPTLSPTDTPQEMIRELQALIEQQEQELNDLENQYAAKSQRTQRTCTQHFEDVEERLTC